ncbi:MAG: class I SAM-dependent methyltransferase [Bacteroidota bacterium]
MKLTILDFYANQHTAFLHGAGQQGSNHLLHQLALKGQERVLEIGFGTGGSLVKLKSRFPDLQLFGVEQSERMYQKARQRLGLCLLSDVQLHLINSPHYPFPDQHFDVIYVESVLAILTTPQLKQVLKEIRRLLKPGGKLGFNETLWLSEVPQAEVERINATCLEAFGIIQANGEIRDAAAWKDLLASERFELQYCEPVEAKRLDWPSDWHRWPSAAFSKIGKGLAALRPAHRQQAQQLQAIEQRIFEPGKRYLNSYVFLVSR